MGHTVKYFVKIEVDDISLMIMLLNRISSF